MTLSAPYIQRRGFGITFRIAVPHDLRKQLGIREITKALPTTNRQEAVPIALSLAHQAKLLFFRLRQRMKKINNSENESLELGYTLELELDSFGFPTKVKVQAEVHEEDAVNTALKTVFDSRNDRRLATSDTAATSRGEHTATKSSVPMLSEVVNAFLDGYHQAKKPAMFKKHQPVLHMLVDVIGDKPVDKLLQKDINDFFDLLARLPPRWNDQCRQRGISVRELAELDHEVTLGPKTFNDTYLASVRPFLKVARRDYQDRGFPTILTTEGTEYKGDREEGEHKQRALSPIELKRLFEGAEMRHLAADVNKSHCYWLPHIGLFTGARVNEICQLNPQTDILQDRDTGVWYFWITTTTESDPRVRKSVKTGDARKVPIHNTLLDLGLLDYVGRVKNEGAMLLFPQWAPVNRRASGEAEDWFRQLLKDIGLRDETLKARLTGMHAFRHTLLTYGAMRKPTPLSLFCITGHAQDDTPIWATGAGKGYLTLSLLSPIKDRSDLLNQLDYDLNFVHPVTA
jgi:integrase